MAIGGIFEALYKGSIFFFTPLQIQHLIVQVVAMALSNGTIYYSINCNFILLVTKILCTFVGVIYMVLANQNSG
jgi:hypothetical protein